MADDPKLKIVRPSSATPSDALDIEALWLDPALGDGLTDISWSTLPIDKPRDFFRVHPDKGYRRRTEIYVHKLEGEIETQYYILDPAMRGRLEEARPCVLAACIYRDGTPRLWPLMLPREGEKDNKVWVSARAAARAAIDKWVRLVWAKRVYLTRDAQPGYSPDPDWDKLPTFNKLVEVAFGVHGIICDTEHPIYRDLIGQAPQKNDDDAEL